MDSFLLMSAKKEKKKEEAVSCCVCVTLIFIQIFIDFNFDYIAQALSPSPSLLHGYTVFSLHSVSHLLFISVPVVFVVDSHPALLPMGP